MDRRAILRIAIPVDDAWHKVLLRGPIVHVATRYRDEVEVWFLNLPDQEPVLREFTVVGTGHDMPAGEHIGTAIVPRSALVWHLIERVDQEVPSMQQTIVAADGR